MKKNACVVIKPIKLEKTEVHIQPTQNYQYKHEPKFELLGPRVKTSNMAMICITPSVAFSHFTGDFRLRSTSF